ncbi:CENPB DNA-binding domain containing protein 1-like 38 [Homarus americanus]|uniref:CENPB DNA-binding domain containing protein 1-like 38 n=1 Tax=Homarus americanus TaxID=6706 RepID=A0A8J5N8Z3_HOMAM|nr:CENPB DNA-binding domain containing protein 1-like 38 [Homarus americanus]
MRPDLSQTTLHSIQLLRKLQIMCGGYVGRELDIVKRHEHGEGTSVIGCVHGLAPSTVHSIVKSADKIKEMAGSAIPLTATKVTRFRDAEMKNMEQILSNRYNKENKALMVIDNAPGHPPAVVDW